MAKYITKQRKSLIAFFEKHIDEPVSARQIAESPEGRDISLSAIYRNIAAFEEEGIIQRVSIGDSHEICFRYKACEQCANCLHLSCKKCGKTFHLNDRGAKQIVGALSETEGFSLDKSETILYGICGKCKELKTV